MIEIDKAKELHHKFVASISTYDTKPIEERFQGLAKEMDHDLEMISGFLAALLIRYTSLAEFAGIFFEKNTDITVRLSNEQVSAQIRENPILRILNLTIKAMFRLEYQSVFAPHEINPVPSSLDDIQERIKNLEHAFSERISGDPSLPENLRALVDYILDPMSRYSTLSYLRLSQSEIPDTLAQWPITISHLNIALNNKGCTLADLDSRKEDGPEEVSLEIYGRDLTDTLFKPPFGYAQSRLDAISRLIKPLELLLKQTNDSSELNERMNWIREEFNFGSSPFGEYGMSPKEQESYRAYFEKLYEERFHLLTILQEEGVSPLSIGLALTS